MTITWWNEENWRFMLEYQGVSVQLLLFSLEITDRICTTIVIKMKKYLVKWNPSNNQDIRPYNLKIGGQKKSQHKNSGKF